MNKGDWVAKTHFDFQKSLLKSLHTQDARGKIFHLDYSWLKDRKKIGYGKLLWDSHEEICTGSSVNQFIQTEKMVKLMWY